mmetsp:Transcript_8326/g.34907  ORF Transcript_8326/g.34907 Transcript_8326/m.34907 type:complete len:209 (-) Transcript_8326:112-738(-)
MTQTLPSVSASWALPSAAPCGSSPSRAHSHSFSTSASARASPGASSSPPPSRRPSCLCSCPYSSWPAPRACLPFPASSPASSPTPPHSSCPAASGRLYRSPAHSPACGRTTWRPLQWCSTTAVCSCSTSPATPLPTGRLARTRWWAPAAWRSWTSPATCATAIFAPRPTTRPTLTSIALPPLLRRRSRGSSAGTPSVAQHTGIFQTQQ